METILIKLTHAPDARFAALEIRACEKFRRLHPNRHAEAHGLVRCLKLDAELCLSLFKFIIPNPNAAPVLAFPKGRWCAGQN